MAFECQKAWEVSSGLANDAWNEEIASCPELPSAHSSRVNEVETQAKISSNVERSTYALTDIDHNNHCLFLELPPVLISEILSAQCERTQHCFLCMCSFPEDFFR